MKIQIRKLNSNESDSYRKIRLECLKDFPEHFGSNYEDEKTKTKLLFQPYIEDTCIDNFVIGAFHENHLIGISGFNRYEKNKIKHRGRIIQVYVNTKYQGQNIGLNILKLTISEAFNISGIEQIEINVLTTNIKAEKIYERIGFETYGIQRKYLKTGGKYYDQKMMILFKDQFKS